MTDEQLEMRLAHLAPQLPPEERGRVLASAKEAVAAAARLRAWLDARPAAESTGQP